MLGTEDDGPILAQKILERINEMEIKEEDKKLIKNFIRAFMK